MVRSTGRPCVACPGASGAQGRAWWMDGVGDGVGAPRWLSEPARRLKGALGTPQPSFGTGHRCRSRARSTDHAVCCVQLVWALGRGKSRWLAAVSPLPTHHPFPCGTTHTQTAPLTGPVRHSMTQHSTTQHGMAQHSMTDPPHSGWGRAVAKLLCCGWHRLVRELQDGVDVLLARCAFSMLAAGAMVWCWEQLARRVDG